MIADIVIIIIMALCILLGYIRGLLGVAVRILGFIAALVIAFILYTPISNYIIKNTDFVANIQETIEGKIYTEEENIKGNNIDTQNLTVENYIEDYTEEMKKSGAEAISGGAATAIVKVRNMDRTIYNRKNINDIYKNICKHNRKNTNNKTIQ